jgi:hypothetical protein
MTRTIESLDALIARVVAEDARKYDVIADTRKMSVEPGLLSPDTVSLVLDGPQGLDEFLLTDHTLGQMATDLGIPKKYFDRMRVEAPDLFKTNAQHWMYQAPKARLVRGFTNGDSPMTGRAWMSDKFRRLDNMEIARTLLPEFENLGTPVEFHQAAITDTRLYIRALFPGIERDVKKVGDTVRWGVEIRNSEIGAGSLTISGFALVLQCLNGMTATKALNARHVGKREDEGILSNEALAADDVAFWLAARDTLRATCTEAAFADVCARLDGLSETQVASPVAATKVLASEFSLTDEEQEAVMLSLAGDPNRIGRGQWGMLNAVTAVAQTVESFDRQAELEGIGWGIAQMSESAWDRVALAVK